MKKKKILILMILSVIILPITVFATNNIAEYQIAVSANEEIDYDYSKSSYSNVEYEKNRQKKQEMQEQYIQENYNTIFVKEEKAKANDITDNKDVELENKINEKNEEITNNIQYIISIVEKFYPNQITEILENAQVEENKMKNSGDYNIISNAECDLVMLIVNIIEQENITEEESNVLKGYISDQEFKIKEIGNQDVLQRIQDVLN